MEELLGELLSSLESDDLLSQPSVSPSTSLGDAASTTTTSSTTTTAATTTSSPGESTRPVSSLTPLQASCHRIGSLIELEFRSLAAGADLPREQQLRLFGAAAADRSAVLLRLQAVLHAMVSNLATSSAGSNDPAAVAAVLRIVTAAEVTLADGSDLPVPPPLLPALAAAMRSRLCRGNLPWRQCLRRFRRLPSRPWPTAPSQRAHCCRCLGGSLGPAGLRRRVTWWPLWAGASAARCGSGHATGFLGKACRCREGASVGILRRPRGCRLARCASFGARSCCCARRRSGAS